MNIASMVIAIVILASVPQVRADHTPLPDSITPLRATWLWGHHSIPGTITSDGSPYWYAYPHTDSSHIDDPPWTKVAARQVKAGMKAPAVIYLHGCTGMYRGGVGYRVLLLELGFAVFEPDAYARPGHTCDGSSYSQRREEAAYALEQVRLLPWIQQDRVVLIGFSEGGRAAGSWSEPGFAAIVIAAAKAAHKAPEGTPVLAVAGANDKWAQPSSYSMDRVLPSRAVLIQDASHEIISHPEFKSILKQFLTDAVLAR
jgi:dienelactone hydrolase